MEEIYGWDYNLQIEKTKKELDRHINDMKIIVVAQKDVGITTFYKENDEYIVGLTLIHPDYRNKGIATNILSGYIDLAKKKIKIKTYKYNPAQKLYKRLGFKEVKTDGTHVLCAFGVLNLSGGKSFILIACALGRFRCKRSVSGDSKCIILSNMDSV